MLCAVVDNQKVDRICTSQIGTSHQVEIPNVSAYKLCTYARLYVLYNVYCLQVLIRYWTPQQ